MVISEEKKLNNLNGKEWIIRTISWFILRDKNRTKLILQHPGTFQEALVERFVTMFTKKNQWVFDPFVGTGTTLVSCRHLERNAIGIELSQDFIQIAKERLKQKTLIETTKQYLLQGDSNQMESLFSKLPEKPQLDFCITSPPYWNMLNKKRGNSHSQHEQREQNGLQLNYGLELNNLGNEDSYSNYLTKLINIFVLLKKYLKPNAYIVVVIQNMRDSTGSFIPIAWDFAFKMREYYELCQEQIWCQDNKQTGIWGFPTTYISNVHHHYCLVFRNTL